MSRTISTLILRALENLSDNDMERFCFHLTKRKEEPKIGRGQVEDKRPVKITELLISTFTEAGAREVVLETLRLIGCNQEAQNLVEECAKQSSNSGSDDAKASCGATGGNGKAEGGCPEKHFVDKHKLELINRVSNIEPILDELLEKEVIQEEAYAKIRALSTSQEKMRELFITSLRASDTCKDIFYEILKKKEAYLVDDLLRK